MGISDDNFDGTDVSGLVAANRSVAPGIIVVSNEARVAYALPSGGSLTVGRSRACDVQIDQPSISRRHVTIYGTFPVEVEDLGSSNGTWLDGERLERGKRVSVAAVAYLELGSVLVIVNSGAPPVSRVRRSSATRDGHAQGSQGNHDVAGLGPSSMEVVRERIELVAKSMVSVLIVGETGVGKGAIARTVHRKSRRANQPFVGIHCAACSDAELESELFGFEAGAVGAARYAKPGLLERAHGGTLFLDELGEMSLPIQAKLVGALETRQVRRLGGLRPRPIDVRFVAATNQDLQALVTEGRFRGDLYFRLEGIVIAIPPLRDRLDEIPELAATFVRAACEGAGRSELKISEEAITKLKTFQWPGNVRQLENVVERAVLVCSGDTISPSHLWFEDAAGGARAIAATPSTSAPAPSDAPVEEITRGGKHLLASQRKVVFETLAMCAGNQSAAARILGISRATLVKRLDMFELPRPRKKAP